MIKVVLMFLVGIVVVASSVSVPVFSGKALASSSGRVLITNIQAGGVGAAPQEFIVLYNNSATEVDVTGWCLTNKGGVAIYCFTPPTTGQAMYLPSYRHAAVVSVAFAATLPAGATKAIYTPANQSTGSITGASDTISLFDHAHTLVDSYSWTTALGAGMQQVRRSEGAPAMYVDTDMPADWAVTTSGPLPTDGVEIDETIVDICPNLEGLQIEIPNLQEHNSSGECVDIVVPLLLISEVLPNAVGTDAGREFIEIYNPNEFAVPLSGYKLFIGPQFNSSYEFPANVVIEPLGYMVFSSTEIPFSFLNSSSQAAISSNRGPIVGLMSPYVDPEEGQSWALIDGVWQYTNWPTPGAANIPMGLSLEEEVLVTAKPCATNQYRSPETGRCRLLALVTGVAAPCKDGQYRSEETNRCRNIASDVKVVTPCDANEERNLETNRCRKIAVVAQPTPCKEGQERSPETNRCRTVPRMSAAGFGVLGAETKSDGSWYMWAAIGGVVLLALAYAAWEWRDVMKRFMQKCRRLVIGFARRRN